MNGQTWNPTHPDIQALIDPEVKAVLDTMPPFGALNDSTYLQVRESRKAMVAMLPVGEGAERTSIAIPASGSQPEVVLHIRRPAGVSGDLPAMFWVHGGGYVLGSPQQDDPRWDSWCPSLGIVVVCVQYRLAPEDPFPAGFDDCVTGLEWLLANGASIGVDVNRIGIGGASAGGGLAAGLGMYARDHGLPIRYQLLIYPMIDDQRVTPSSQWEVPIWPPASNEFGWTSYLAGLTAAGSPIPAYAAATRAEDLRGLPPTIVVVGTIDGFMDEDLAYVARLNHAGVPVELHVYPGAPHGFDSFAPSSAIARQCRRDLHDWLARMLS